MHRGDAEVTAPSVARSRTWAKAGTHTVKLVVVSSAGHARVDLDAFEVLR